MESIRVGVIGACGRMGRGLIKAILEHPMCTLSGALEHPDHPCVGKDAADLVQLPLCNTAVTSDASTVFQDSDVLINFALPTGLTEHLEMAKNFKKAMVIGSTGLTKETLGAIDSCSKEVPLMAASNFSEGVSLLNKLVARATTTLAENEYDIQILESHHKNKKDAPSGTALTLKKVIQEARANNTIQAPNVEIAAIRGGNLPGEHTVMFIGKNDMIEIKHTAFNRDIFVSGALKAALWLAKASKPKLYKFEDVINSCF